MHYSVQPRHLHYTDVMLCHVQVSFGLGQGWQVFATWQKKPDFSMEKNCPGKNSFCQLQKLVFAVYWQKLIF